MLNWVESIVHNNFAKCLLLTFVTGHTGSKKFGRKSEKSAKFFWFKISRNENFNFQSGYGEQTLRRKFF